MTTKPKTVTEPVIAADEAFGNVLIATRDTAVVDEQALQGQRTARMGQNERDLARLSAAFNADMASLDQQIATQINVQAAADAALASLKGASNVVPLKSVAAQ